MKQYDYSVKDKIISVFGENYNEEMRKDHNRWEENLTDDKVIAYAWRYAHDKALRYLEREKIFVDFTAEDDYFVYIYKVQETLKAYIMFMLYEEDRLLPEIDYADEVLKKWESQGYETEIMLLCIRVKESNNGRILFNDASGDRNGVHILVVETINGKKIYHETTNPCWPHYYRKLIGVVKSDDIIEYQCLMEDTVCITAGEGKSKNTVCSGIEKVKEYLKSHGELSFGYYRGANSLAYSYCIRLRDRRIVVYVNRSNQIAEIRLANQISKNDFIDVKEEAYGNLLAEIPNLLSARLLDVDQMYAYAYQLQYANGTRKNFYLINFTDTVIPEKIEKNGFSFTRESAGKFHVKDDSLIFENGYTIPKHILFYRSRRIVEITNTGNVVCENEDVRIESLYLLPHMHYMNHFSIEQYWGNEDECYGPTEAFIDENGRRVSDVEVYSRHQLHYGNEFIEVRIAPTALYGIATKEGKWVVPPIYGDLEVIDDGLIKASKYKNGEEEISLIDKNWSVISFNYEINIHGVSDGLCPYNDRNNTWVGEAPRAGYYWEEDYEVWSGNWGFIDLAGNVVVKPQYVYAIGFWNGGGEHSIVAKMVDGELLWGAIDKKGNETIPCKYERLYTRWGHGVAYRLEPDGLYGLMDFDGNIIIPPSFGVIKEYDLEHRLITAGEDEDHLGVYSIEKKKMLTETKYGYIGYGKYMMDCELAWSSVNEYFDYDGNQIMFEEYSCIFEAGENYSVWKDGKHALIDRKGDIIIPPINTFGDTDEFDLYNEGLVYVGERKYFGISKLDGTVVIPPLYTEVIKCDGFYIASIRKKGNQGLKDTLYSTQGEILLEGNIRDMHYDSENHILTYETPLGKEYLRVIAKN